MSIINFRTIILFGLVNILSCKAQQTYPLLTAIKDVPSMSHLKDTNNELQSFVGIYSSTFNGNQIILYITKVNDKLFDFGDKQIYRDVISICYTVKNSSGMIIQSTQNMNFQPNQYNHTIYSQWIIENGTKAVLNYRGTNCRVGWGTIYLKKINTTQLSWEYRPNDIIVDDTKCPPGTDTTIYLPETKDLIFTKQ